MGFIAFLFKVIIIYWLFKLLLKGLILFFGKEFARRNFNSKPHESENFGKKNKKDIVDAEFKEID
ncbi:MAG: hypothetical protein PHP69_06900 [Candidatus Omnitrophica bacterium]|nr:hypothetical protein [Candidatus Omnitrophota bacterium]MDD5081682.1 hypothetical protein [Candidatus Omnitrophota bacterium]MDD5441467.1 hypothetical protein [Candidatus Omnitrophota bacterium]